LLCQNLYIAFKSRKNIQKTFELAKQVDPKVRQPIWQTIKHQIFKPLRLKIKNYIKTGEDNVIAQFVKTGDPTKAMIHQVVRNPAVANHIPPGFSPEQFADYLSKQLSVVDLESVLQKGLNNPLIAGLSVRA